MAPTVCHPRTTRTRTPATSSLLPLLLCLALAPTPARSQLEQLLLQREAEVRNLAVRSKELFDGRCTLADCGCSYSTCQSRLSNATCSNVDTEGCGAGGTMKLDFGASSTRLAFGTNEQSEQVRESVCFGRGLDEGPFKEFKETTIAREPGFLQQMMLGSFTGAYRIFPGRGEECVNYDPRIRPWYVAASSGPKDVLLVLDESGSMQANSRMPTLKSAVHAVLDTLTLTDYFNVISFSDEAAQLLGEEDELVWASSENLKEAKRHVDAMQPDSGTNFHAAFTKAFKILNKQPQERTSNCQKIILFLTDGAHSDGRNTLEQVYELVRTENAKGARKTPIFSYSLGAGALEGPPKRLSCESGGVHAAIDDGGQNLRNAMTHYYDFAAIGNYESYKDLSSATAKPVWVEPYEFASPPGVMGTTVAMPIYDDQTRTLIGVAAIDVTVRSLVEAAGSSGQLLESLRTRSGRCNLPDLSDCQLEALRQKNGGAGNTCGSCSAGSSPLEPAACATRIRLDRLYCNTDGPSEECCPLGGDRGAEGAAEGGSGGIGAGAIAGIVIGVVVLVAVVAVAVFIVRRRATIKNRTVSPEPTQEGGRIMVVTPPPANPDWQPQAGMGVSMPQPSAPPMQA